MSDTRPQPRHGMRDDDPRQGQPLRPHPPADRPVAAAPRPSPTPADRRRPQRRTARRRVWRDRAGIALGLLLAGAGVYGSLELGQARACLTEQAAGLAAVQDNIRTRSEITKQQSDADRRLVGELRDNRSPGAQRDAYSRWLAIAEPLAAQRSDSPYPEVRSCQ